MTIAFCDDLVADGGEDDPAGEGRRQDRRGDQLIGLPVNREHALGAVFGVQRGPQGFKIQAARVEPNHISIDADGEGEVQAKALAQIGDG